MIYKAWESLGPLWKTALPYDKEVTLWSKNNFTAWHDEAETGTRHAETFFFRIRSGYHREQSFPKANQRQCAGFPVGGLGREPRNYHIGRSDSQPNLADLHSFSFFCRALKVIYKAWESLGPLWKTALPYDKALTLWSKNNFTAWHDEAETGTRHAETFFFRIHSGYHRELSFPKANQRQCAGFPRSETHLWRSSKKRGMKSRAVLFDDF